MFLIDTGHSVRHFEPTGVPVLNPFEQPEEE